MIARGELFFDNSEYSDLATSIENKYEQDFVVKHEDEREKDGSDILSEVEVIE